MTKDFNWKKWVRPEILLLFGALQANLPYLLWFCGYPVLRENAFHITYKPLYLWIFAYIAFCLGTSHVSFCLCRKVCKRGGISPFRIRQGTFRICILITIFAVIIQILLACLLYGVLPIWAYFSGYHVSILNATQKLSSFGQLGMLTLSVFLLNALILIGIISNFKSKARHRKILCVAVIVVVFASLFSGKTQVFFITICFALVGGALTGFNPVNLFMKKMGLRQFSKKQMLFVIIGLLLILTLTHGFTRSLRTRNLKDFSLRSSVDWVVKYLSFPLINMEGITNSDSLEPHAQISDLFVKLFPYKLRNELFGIAIKTTPRLIPSSPSGFLAGPLWYSGFWGLMAFMFITGIVCKLIYIKSNKSLFCLLAYSQIAWTLVAAHSYNHFLNLLFIPAPLIAFFIITKIVRSKQVASGALVYGPNSSVNS